ncbi:hypothetical protein C9994_03425 [Marivirga lumbricoides]|uniref:Fibronectin type-III domain-containing protein n=1 Tax=Marivirga lumbricoides TaxID=1046115 RepID=A0A2T4DU53_9BACT|nr:hypothetical protein C9994_03425 [Marivirga lumbricoides]
MKNIFKSIGLAVIALSMFTLSCSDDIDPVISDLNLDRPLAPVNLRAFVRNQTAIELSWNVNENISEYVVEFSQDSLDFNSIIRTVSISPDSLPLRENFEGETQYSARVKAVREDGEESSWAEVAIMTAIENILEPLEGGDIAATSVTFRWPAGSEVTNFTLTPGSINRQITEDEKEAGEATIEGLTGSTLYTATLFNGSKRRGLVEFETLVDIGNATPVYPEDDLLAIIAAAAEGDVLALFPGNYGNDSTLLTIDLEKSITLRGVYPFDRPVVYGKFTSGVGVGSVEIRSIIFKGEGESQFFNSTSTDFNLQTLLIDDCDVSGYADRFIYNQGNGTYGSITVSNSYVHDIVGNSGDGFDFRGGTVGALTLQNSTFANAFRTFIRMQVESDVVVNNCTFYKVSTLDNGNNRGLFRASGGGSIEVSNCLFVGIGIPDTERGFWTKSGDMSANTSYSNNYYFDSPVLFAAGSEYTNPAEVDATEADPGFEDPENDDFTITNQTLIDNQVGDPRWR